MPADRPFAHHRRVWLRPFVIALTSLLAFTACSATAQVAVTEAGREAAAAPQSSSDIDAEAADGAPAGEDSVDSVTEDDSTDGAPTPDEPSLDEPSLDEPSLDEPSVDEREADDGSIDGTDTGEEAAESEPVALYEVQGELPLAVNDVNGLITFIQQVTGRDFLRPPVIVAQTPEAFAADIDETFADFDESADTTVRTLQALGLTTQGVAEVSDAWRNLLSSPEGVLGYYDPDADELYVPVGALGDDDFRSLLVHELTHALDGQHADLGRLEDLADEAEITGDFEPVLALQAVGEGRATSVQNRWMRENDVPQQQNPGDLGALEAVPPAMVLGLSLPYGFGEQYIESQGGPSRTWELLDTPPASSEEFLVAGGDPEEIVDIPTPRSDGPIIDDTVFGAADLFVWILGESLEPQPSLIFPTFSAVDGWAGGRSVLWGDETESCIRITLAADTPADLTEIQELLTTWAGDDANRVITQDTDDRVTATGCAPYVP